MRTEQRKLSRTPALGLALGLLVAAAASGCGSEPSDSGGVLKVVFSQLYTAHEAATLTRCR